MCVIIYKPRGKSIPKDRLEKAFKANPDGWGVLFTMPILVRETQELHDHIFNMKGLEFDSFLDQYKMVEKLEVDYIVHFRTASSGQISEEYCHPFFVNKDLAFMENGNFYEYSNYFPDRERDRQTDVKRFNEEVLKKLPIGFLGIPEIRDALELYCRANFVKIIFMDYQGVITIVNEQAGEWRDGIWYSNGGIESYIGYGYSGAYNYKAGDIRHKGGLISVQQFSPEDRKKWGKCVSCAGWFPVQELNANGCHDCNIWKGLTKYVKH